MSSDLASRTVGNRDLMLTMAGMGFGSEKNRFSTLPRGETQQNSQQSTLKLTSCICDPFHALWLLMNQVSCGWLDAYLMVKCSWVVVRRLLFLSCDV